VRNNPILYTDPTGHRETGPCGEHGEECGGSSSNSTYVPPASGENYCTTHPWACGGNTPDDDVDDILSGNVGNNDETINPLVEILNYYNDGINQTMSNNGCWDSFSVFWNNAACLDLYANLTQDIATLFSTTGASITLTTTLLGCVPASGVGCAAGYAYGFGIYQTFFNPYESIFSSTSLLLTARSDILTNDTYITNLTDWQIGEDTKTSFGTALIGALMPEPFIDAGIDIYSSGYNHGYMCGVSTILDCLP